MVCAMQICMLAYLLVPLLSCLSLSSELFLLLWTGTDSGLIQHFVYFDCIRDWKGLT